MFLKGGQCYSIVTLVGGSGLQVEHQRGGHCTDGAVANDGTAGHGCGGLHVDGVGAENRRGRGGRVGVAQRRRQGGRWEGHERTADNGHRNGGVEVVEEGPVCDGAACATSYSGRTQQRGDRTALRS
jgi:hypothetical protein